MMRKYFWKSLLHQARLFVSPNSCHCGKEEMAYYSVQSLSCVQLFVTPRTAVSRPPCPSPTPGACSNSCPLSRWCHPTISPSVVPFSFCLQSFLALGSFPRSQFSGLISFRIDWFDLLAVQGTLKRLLQHHRSKASILRCSAFFIVQLSHPYMATGKNIALIRWTFVGNPMNSMKRLIIRTFNTYIYVCVCVCVCVCVWCCSIHIMGTCLFFFPVLKNVWCLKHFWIESQVWLWNV